MFYLPFIFSGYAMKKKKNKRSKRSNKNSHKNNSIITDSLESKQCCHSCITPYERAAERERRRCNYFSVGVKQDSFYAALIIVTNKLQRLQAH